MTRGCLRINWIIEIYLVSVRKFMDAREIVDIDRHTRYPESIHAPSPVCVGPGVETSILERRLTLRDCQASRFASQKSLPHRLLPAKPVATASQATWSHSYFCLCLLIVNCLLLAGGPRVRGADRRREIKEERRPNRTNRARQRGVGKGRREGPARIGGKGRRIYTYACTET